MQQKLYEVMLSLRMTLLSTREGEVTIVRDNIPDYGSCCIQHFLQFCGEINYLYA